MSIITFLFTQPVFLKLLEVIGGLLSVGGFLLKFIIPNDGLSKKELLKMIEEKDSQIERLTIQNHAHRLRLESISKKHKR